MTPNPRGQRFCKKRSTAPRGEVRHTARRAGQTDRGEDKVDSLSFIPPKGKGYLKRADRNNAVSPLIFCCQLSFKNKIYSFCF